MTFTNEPTASTAAWAQFLAALGMPVFPVHGIVDANICTCGSSACGASRGKHPLFTGGFHQATTDVTQIAKWWTQHPIANVGIATSASFTVLDIDERNGGLESYAVLEAELGADVFRSPYRVRTGNGWHIGFRAPVGTGSRTGVRAGIDIKAERGYVVAPGSRHLSGSYYLFEPALTAPFYLAALPELPSNLLADKRRNDPHAAATGKVGVGNRNEVLTKIGGMLRRYGPDANDLSTMMKVVNTTLMDPPLSDAEVERTATSLAKYESAVPSIAFIGADELVASGPEHVPWIVQGIVAEGVVTEFLGQPKAGKSTFIRAMLSSVLTGMPFLGLAVTACPVVMLAEEGDTSLRHGFKRHGLATNHLRVAQKRKVAAASWSDIVDAAIIEAKRINARIIVVDTLPGWALGDSDENSASDAMKAIEPLQRAASEGLAIIIVRHQRKTGGDVVAAGRGSSAFAGAADIVFTLQHHQGRPTVRVMEAKSRFEETPAKQLVEWTTSGYVSHGDGRALDHQAQVHAVLGVMPRNETDALPESKIEQELSGTSHEMGRTKLREVLAKLATDGVLCVVGTGKKNSPRRYWAR